MRLIDDEMRTEPTLLVRPALLSGLAVFVMYLALDEQLSHTRAWPFRAIWELLFVVVAGLVARRFGPRVSWRVATVILAASLGVLTVLARATPLT
ncbi:MAG: hypothetical protein ABIP93_19155 [Gemmatimonadaceae bacterium]